MAATIGILIGVCALIVAYLTYQSQSKVQLKRLHYSSNYIDLILPRDSFAERVTISVGGDDLIYPSLCLLRVVNTGKAPITPADFDGPMILDFGTNAWVRFAQIDFKPADILRSPSQQIGAQAGKISLAPMLLNPHDSFEVIAITDGIPIRPRLLARIAGVEEVASLAPLNDGVNIVATVSSLIYQLREDWPSPGELIADVASIPIIIDPGKGFGDRFDTSVDGELIRAPGLVQIDISTPRTCGIVNVAEIDKPVRLRMRAAEILELTAMIDEQELAGETLSSYVHWDKHTISITPAPLKYDCELRIVVLVSGPGYDISVEAMPSLMHDIRLMSVEPGDFVERNLVKAEPIILLSNQTLHRFWLRCYPKLQKKLERIRKVVTGIE